MKREKVIEILEHNWTCLKNHAYTDNELDEALEYIIKSLEQEPCEDAVSRGVFEQVRWERDVAIEQLKELGYELGQKIEPCEDYISRQAVLDTLDTADKFLDEDRTVERYKAILTEAYKVLPSVNPQEPILNKIREEIHENAEMQSDGEWYLNEKWIMQIIDKYRQEG